jgi:hypothetical protein
MSDQINPAGQYGDGEIDAIKYGSGFAHKREIEEALGVVSSKNQTNGVSTTIHQPTYFGHPADRAVARMKSVGSGAYSDRDGLADLLDSTNRMQAIVAGTSSLSILLINK